MTATTTRTATAEASTAIERLGSPLARYGLVVVIGWIGLMKFTSFEAHGIESLVADSPLMSWLYDIFSATTFSSLLGVVEVATAVLLAVKPWWPRLSAAGSVMAIGLFIATFTFLFSTPGVFEASEGGFPMLSSTGQFLIKDVALLGISVWTLTDALRASRAAG
jgi:reactive chlorine resistance protein C